jgi:hypothetical protein
MIRLFLLFLSFSALGQNKLDGLLEPNMDFFQIEEKGDSLQVTLIRLDSVIVHNITRNGLKELMAYKAGVLSKIDTIDFYRPYQLLFKPFEPLQRQLVISEPPSFRDFPYASLCTEATLNHENFKQHPYLIKKHSISTQVNMSSWKSMTDAEVTQGSTVLVVQDLNEREAPLIIEAKSIRDDFGGLLLDLSQEWQDAIKAARIVHINVPFQIGEEVEVAGKTIEFSPELLTINGPQKDYKPLINFSQLQNIGIKSMVVNHGHYTPKNSSNIINHFYKNLFDGDRKHDALKKAQKKFIQKKTDPKEAHPYYWAGWKVYGDIKSVNNTVNPYFYLLIIGLLLFSYILIKKSNVKMY